MFHIVISSALLMLAIFMTFLTIEDSIDSCLRQEKVKLATLILKAGAAIIWGVFYMIHNCQ